MMEVWKDIEGYEGLYQVSNMGRVKSLNHNHTDKERILKLSKRKDGYLRVQVWKNSNCKNYYVHRLVAQAFLNNPYNLNEVNHKDEDKTNNHANNIEWCDRKYNCNYGTRNKRHSEKMKKTVYQYTLDGKFIAKYPSTKEVERQFGYGQGNISQCCNGKRKTAYGYKWTY